LKRRDDGPCGADEFQSRRTGRSGFCIWWSDRPGPRDLATVKASSPCADGPVTDVSWCARDPRRRSTNDIGCPARGVIRVSGCDCDAGHRRDAGYAAGERSTPAGTAAGSRRAALTGSAVSPQVLTCSQEATNYTGAPAIARPGDLIVGPLSIPAGPKFATGDPKLNGTHGSYKTPPVLVPGSTVTITIAPRARRFVVMSNPDSPRGGAVAATYRACAHKRGRFPRSGLYRWPDPRRRAARCAHRSRASAAPCRPVAVRSVVPAQSSARVALASRVTDGRSS
jgi:hypothetical protein